MSTNAHYKGINTKYPDFVLTSPDTSVEVTFAVYPWSENVNMRRILNYLYFLIMVKTFFSLLVINHALNKPSYMSSIDDGDTTRTADK